MRRDKTQWGSLSRTRLIGGAFGFERDSGALGPVADIRHGSAAAESALHAAQIALLVVFRGRNGRTGTGRNPDVRHGKRKGRDGPQSGSHRQATGRLETHEKNLQAHQTR